MGNWQSYPAGAQNEEEAAKEGAAPPESPPPVEGADLAAEWEEAAVDLGAAAEDDEPQASRAPQGGPVLTLPSALFFRARAGEEVADSTDRAPWRALALGTAITVRNSDNGAQSFMAEVAGVTRYEGDEAMRVWADTTVKPMAAVIKRRGALGLRLRAAA